MDESPKQADQNKPSMKKVNSLRYHLPKNLEKQIWSMVIERRSVALDLECEHNLGGGNPVLDCEEICQNPLNCTCKMDIFY